MKNLKISLAVLALVLASTLVNAQSTPLVQLKFGVPSVSTNPKLDGYAGTFGFGFGVAWEKALSDNFYFQPGLMYQNKSFKRDHSEDLLGVTYKFDYKNNFSSLEVPLYFLYKTADPSASTRFLFGFGPNLGFRMGGKWEQTTTIGTASPVTSDGKIEYGSSDSSDMKSFIFGIGVQAGVEFGGRFQVAAEYMTDINDAKSNSGTVERTAMFGLRLGILLNANAY